MVSKKFAVFFIIVVAAFFYVKYILTSGAFLAFLDSHKQYKLVRFLQYQIGNIYYLKSEYKNVIKQYEKFRSFYPISPYDKKIDYKVASSYEFLMKKDKAKTLYREYLNKYPDTPKKNLIIKKLQILEN